MARASITPCRVPMDARSRAWCFTWNNYPADAVDVLNAIDCERLAVGYEFAPTTGTPHLQGYIRFGQPKRFSWWKSNFPQISVQVRRGTETQAAEYCLKGGQIAIDRGVNFDESVEKGLSRNEEAMMVIQEIEQGAKYGQIRDRHKLFCFWNSAKVKDYIKDTVIN